MKNKLLQITIFIICVIPKLSLKAQSNQLFLNSPKVISEFGNYYRYSEESRKFTGVPSIAISPNGRMWAIWYAGATPNEDENNYVVLSTSEDGGTTWKEILVVDPDGKGPVRAFDPEVWTDPEGKLWIFWGQTIDHDGTIAGVWSLTSTDSNNINPVWSEPRRLTDGIMMCKPIVLSNGEWIIPASTWRFTDKSAKVIISKDKGQTWIERGAVDVPKEDREYDEHMIIEKKDGTLWMLVRTKYGIGESFSKDQGKSWSDLVPSAIKHPSALFFIQRLRSGNLLLVKHGPIDVKIGRSHLMAFISNDDGLSWSKGLLLDERNGISYPDGQQFEDGTIFITYDFNRTKEQMILMTSFKEEDILGNDYNSRIIEVYNHRKIISEGIETIAPK